MGTVNLKDWFDSSYGGGTGVGFWNREDYSTPNNVPAWDALSPDQKLEFLKTGGISSLGFQDKAPNWAGAFDNRTPEQVLSSGQINFADPQGNEGIGGMLKTLGVFAGAAGLGGLMGGGLGGLGATGESLVGPAEFAANAGVGAGGGASTGGGMWDWLDNIINSGGPDTGAENMFGFEGAPPEALRELSQLPPTTNLQDKITAVDSIAGKYGINPTSLLQSVLGISGAGGDAASGGGFLNKLLSDPLGSAFNATPFLLALQQANKQSKDLNGVLSQIDGAGYQKSVLDPYDLQTGLMRTAQTDSLGQRGVLGSSFGDQSLNSFDYMRALGRGDLASKAGLASAGLQGSLINQRNVGSNLLLGAGLNASGRLFSPQKDPFNIDTYKALGIL